MNTHIQLGQYAVANAVWLAPMAGVTDRPFRILCRSLGAGHAVSEMAASNPELWLTEKTSRRINHTGEPGPVAVQLAGSNPEMLAQAAGHNIAKGAQIIDLNMGCPAKKVCKAAAGSALLQDEPLVERILQSVYAVCKAHDVPLTLKYRTGPTPESRNAVRIAQMAERIGVAALVLHGRTRACGFTGHAEYDTIAQVKQTVGIPIIANGDISTPFEAKQVLETTQADGIMIGRAALGNPWIFRQILSYLNNGLIAPKPTLDEAHQVMLHHMRDHIAFYGETMGVRTIRKHLQWYFGIHRNSSTHNPPHNLVTASLMDALMQINDANHQIACVDAYFNDWKNQGHTVFDPEHAPPISNALHKTLTQTHFRQAA